MDSFKVKMGQLMLSITFTMTMTEYVEINTHNTSTFMGLDNYLSPDMPQKIKMRKRSIWNTVLSEQSFQIDANIKNPEAIYIVT